MNNNDENDKIIIANEVNNSKKIQIYYYFYILRIISSFAIVLIHVTAEYFTKCKIQSNDFKISFFYNGFSRFGVPIFFMISGALFLNRDLSFTKMYSKYIKRLLIHLISWSFIYSLTNFHLSKKSIKIIIFKFFSGHYHLWFLYSMIGLYIITPFLREIAKKDDLLKMFILLSIVFSFLFPNFNIIISYYSNSYYNILNYTYFFLDLKYISGNVFYFMIGYYLNNNNTKLNYFITIFIFIIGISGTLFIFKLSYNIVLKDKKKKTLFFQPEYLHIAVYSISIFILIKNHFTNKKLSKIYLINIISNNAFGIYLAHPLIIEKTKQYRIFKFTLFIKLIYRIPIITSFIYLFSLLISIMIKYIPLIGEYLF